MERIDTAQARNRPSAENDMISFIRIASNCSATRRLRIYELRYHVILTVCRNGSDGRNVYRSAFLTRTNGRATIPRPFLLPTRA